MFTTSLFMWIIVAILLVKRTVLLAIVIRDLILYKLLLCLFKKWCQRMRNPMASMYS